MRILNINNKPVDIDDNTAIGVDYQARDFKKPGQRLIKISNNFTIPKTSNNLEIFGFASDPQSMSTRIYGKNTCNYWVNNDHLFKDANIRVEEIKDRIKLFVFEKPDIWDTLKEIKYPDFEKDFVDWIIEDLDLPTIGDPYNGSLQEFLSPYTTTTEGIVLSAYFGNLFNVVPTIESLPVEGNYTSRQRICMRYVDGVEDYEGGHFAVFVKKIFEYIEQTYDVNFLTSGGQAGNIWDDAVIPTMYTPLRGLSIYEDISTDDWYFTNPSMLNYFPITEQPLQDKTLYDFVNSFFQIFNVIVDEIEINNEKIYRLARFDDIRDLADTVDWSERIADTTPLYKPFISGYKRNNKIRFSKIFEGGDQDENSKNLTCGNESLDVEGELFTIDGYINSMIETRIYSPDYVPDLSSKDAFSSFSFFVTESITLDSTQINFKREGRVIELTLLKLPLPILYSLDSEYTLLDEILDFPVYLEIERWMNSVDVHQIEFFKKYKIKQLGGVFYLNKISGYNPEKSNKPTKIELIKIPE